MQTVRTSRFPRTPPMEMTRCQAPPVPSVETIDPKHSTVLIRWSPTKHDAGNEPFEYRVEFAVFAPAVGPLKDERAPEWRDAYVGIRRFAMRLSDLLPETEYVFRVSATNQSGRSAFSGYARVKTLKAPNVGLVREKLGQLPRSWAKLESQFDEIASGLTKGEALSVDAKDKAWHETVQVLRLHMPAIKQCFRQYTLLGTFGECPLDISLAQWRWALAELKLDTAPFSSAELDDIFEISNRTAGETRLLELTKLGMPTKEAEALIARESSISPTFEDEDGGRQDRLLKHEFVGALLRVGVMRAVLLETWALKRKSLALALDELLKEHLIPYSVAADAPLMRKLLTARTVRGVLDKWRDKMAMPFGAYAYAADVTVDVTEAGEPDAVDERRDERARLTNELTKGTKASLQLMNLLDLLTLLREAHVLDETHCTVRKVTSLFVLVNVDDEIDEIDEIDMAKSEPRGDARGDANVKAAELSLDEFVELACRIAHAKLNEHHNDYHDVKRKRVKVQGALFGNIVFRSESGEAIVEPNER
ncbi:hypothetical protein Ctob_011034 [Chrysochromulina tobinii]|uniref:Fibronectin type-III domain-containing protein n=1 Tax=Chrysochromulina tobinii TaxID=1460289 RepID=A0A0M0K1Y1_9EUKA|nr:hypothetical protein Ctob_011034 [Chrysochromulina tobinii]|eukprot:KOO32820.1 hypothetical protein Ctob_011034 [Chrysochromulina sp. CCMP291]